MAAYDTCLFDFDGTIVDSREAIITAWQHTYKTLTGKEGNEEEILSTFGEQLDMSLARKFPDTPPEESVKIYRDYQIKRLPKLIHLFPGVKETITELKSLDIKLGVVTSRHKETFDIMFDKFNLGEYFSTVVTSEDTEKHKPDPAPVLKALDGLSADPGSTVMIGDSLYDMMTSHNAGVDFALVSWTDTLKIGESSDGKLFIRSALETSERPEYLIKEPGDIIKLL